MIEIAHLHDRPDLIPLTVSWLKRAFNPEGLDWTEAFIAGLIHQAETPDRLPICLVALQEGQAVGTAWLIESEDPAHPDLRPWLSSVFVLEDCRGRGVAGALVRAIAAHAHRLGFAQLYFGTYIVDFYTRMGAEVHRWEDAEETYAVMCLPLPMAEAACD